MGLQYWFNSPHASVPHAVLSNYVGRLYILHSRLSTLVRKSFEVSQNALQNFSSHTHSTVSMRECVRVCGCVCVCDCVCVSVCVCPLRFLLFEAHFSFGFSSAAVHMEATLWLSTDLAALPKGTGNRGEGEGKGRNCLGAGYGFRFFVCVCVNLATKQRKMYKNRWMFCGPHGNRLRKNIDAGGQHWLDPKPKSE